MMLVMQVQCVFVYTVEPFHKRETPESSSRLLHEGSPVLFSDRGCICMCNLFHDTSSVNLLSKKESKMDELNLITD